MKGEIIAIGDELTSGRTPDGNSAFAARVLFGAGHEITRITTIGDVPAAIDCAIKHALKNAEFLIVTGGLGATSDDLTNEAASLALGLPVLPHPAVLAALFRDMPATGRHPMERLALLPAGAELLRPGGRMAGHMLLAGRVPVFFLPGVPHEMQELMQAEVLPRLAATGGRGRHVRQRLFKTFGLRETEINERLRGLEKKEPRLAIGYYPVFPDVHLSLTVSGDDDPEGIDRLFAGAAAEIQACLGPALFAADTGSMEQTVARLLEETNRSLAVAESCTGGIIAGRLTAVPGISRFFAGGVVAYANRVKTLLLEVPAEILESRGAVSRETAVAMARGVRRLVGADIGLAVTGIAGPDGGSTEKPVGTVHIALDTPTDSLHNPCAFQGSRDQIRQQSAQTALDMLRRYLRTDGQRGQKKSCPGPDESGRLFPGNRTEPLPPSTIRKKSWQRRKKTKPR